MRVSDIIACGVAVTWLYLKFTRPEIEVGPVSTAIFVLCLIACFFKLLA